MLRIVPRTAVQDIYEEYSSKWQGPLQVGSGTWSEDPPQILQKKHKGPSILLLSQVRTLRIQCVTWAGKTRFQITSNNTAICLGIVFPMFSVISLVQSITQLYLFDVPLCFSTETWRKTKSPRIFVQMVCR